MRVGVKSHPGADPDDGSLAVVLAVILVVSLIASSIAFRSVGSAFVTSGQQSSASALSQADAGLADALYRIEQGSTGTGGSSAFCVKPGDSKCVAGSVPATPAVSYLATEVSSSDWLVQSEATVNGQTAAVEEDITRQAAFPFALFGGSSLQLDGASPQSFSTYSSAGPITTTPANPDPAGAVTIGSNGPITCSGALVGSVTVEYFAGGGVSSTGTAGCGTDKSSDTRYYVPSVDAPASASACPGAGPDAAEFGSGIVGAPTSLAGGTYLCTAPISFSGYLDVLGPVQMYVDLDPSLYGPGTAVVSVAPGSYINDQADYCANGGSSGCGSAQNLPSAQNLEIFTADAGQVGTASPGAAFYIGALLYAPNAFLTGDSCSGHYYGALLVGGVSCSGGPPFSVSYDTSLAGLYGPWTAGSYSQINPSSFNRALAASGL